MKSQNEYKRQRVGKYILKALQNSGGSASKQKIKEEIIADEKNNITYEDVYNSVTSARTGNDYIPFNYDFNFSLKELYALGYIERYNRTTDIVLTESGRKANYSTYPNEEEHEIISQYWKQMHQKNIDNKKIDTEKENLEKTEDDKKEDDLVEEEILQVKLLELIKKFSPKKFEIFSRKLFSNMGIVFDNKKGVIMSNDHGIDGYGIFEADDFRTSKVVIQCKRYVDGCVGEPEIDKFRGVISKFSADYGIFITTSYFSEKAKETASKANPTITLIDGQRLVKLIVKYKIGIKEVPVLYYSIDDYYNEQD